jgi:hypothetical protein
MGRMIDKYIEAIPNDVINIMKSLGERKESWGILFMMGNKEEYTLKDMARWFPTLSKNVIRDRYLKPLVSAGLVNQCAHSLVELIDQEKSTYSLSKVGERILKVMEFALEAVSLPPAPSAGG